MPSLRESTTANLIYRKFGMGLAQLIWPPVLVVFLYAWAEGSMWKRYNASYFITVIHILKINDHMQS